MVFPVIYQTHMAMESVIQSVSSWRHDRCGRDVRKVAYRSLVVVQYGFLSILLLCIDNPRFTEYSTPFECITCPLIERQNVGRR